jgi:hypothetical protein
MNNFSNKIVIAFIVAFFLFIIVVIIVVIALTRDKEISVQTDLEKKKIEFKVGK